MKLKKKYYCLIAGLPDIILDDKKIRENSTEFKTELKNQLTKTDFNLAELLYLDIDNKNLLSLLTKENNKFIKNGKYTEEEFQKQIKEPTDIINYFKQFIIDYNNSIFADKNIELIENELQTLYYKHALSIKNDFLTKWILFNVNVKNILTAHNCHKYGYKIENHLINIKENTEIYNNLLKQKPKLEFLSEEVMFADKILQIAESDKNITEKEKEIDNLRWKFLDENTFFYYFTIERVISYIIKLNIVERWLKLDNKTGKKLLEKIIKELTISPKTV